MESRSGGGRRGWSRCLRPKFRAHSLVFPFSSCCAPLASAPAPPRWPVAGSAFFSPFSPAASEAGAGWGLSLGGWGLSLGVLGSVARRWKRLGIWMSMRSAWSLAPNSRRKTVTRERTHQPVARAMKMPTRTPTVVKTSARTAREMADGAAHLVDHVLPRAPVRQWVVSYPFAIGSARPAHPERSRRIQPELLRSVERLVTRTLERWQQRRCQKGRSGGVLVRHRFGSSINLHLHAHVLLLDGAFVGEPGEALTFVRAPKKQVGAPSAGRREQMLVVACHVGSAPQASVLPPAWVCGRSPGQQNGPFGKGPNVSKKLARITDQHTVSSPAWSECRAMIDNVLAGRWAELTSPEFLGYPEPIAERILESALAQYLDERFNISNRELLGR